MPHVDNINFLNRSLLFGSFSPQKTFLESRSSIKWMNASCLMNVNKFGLEKNNVSALNSNTVNHLYFALIFGHRN